MKNLVQTGDVLTLASPYDRLSGQGALVGGIFGVATKDLLSGIKGEFLIEGVVDLAKDTSTFATGDTVYWDNSAKKATSATSGNTIIGAACLTSPDGVSALGGSSGDATVRLRLNEISIGPIASANLNASVLQTASVALAAADLIAMNGAPVSILAAPGVGKAIIVESILFEITTTSTQFTGGGVVTFPYHGGSVATHAGSVPAATVTAVAGTSNTLLGPAVAANGTVVPANTGVDITNGTAGFAAGTGIAKVQVKYRTVTL